jgi:hypothetical protein
MGSKLVRIDQYGATEIIGDVGDNGKQATFDYSFDYLAIASNAKLWLYNGSVINQVTDVDLGTVVDMVWVDGYFMTTDGTSLVVTELNDPFEVNPLKYGSAEADPDPVVALLKVRNEVYALNRNTIEVFDNIGGDLFPFGRIEGAQIQRGVVGTHAACVFLESIAFLGSGRNEAPAIWFGSNSQTTKISTREIDQILLGYSEAELALATLEARVDRGHQHLWITLPDQTLVYDGAASQVMGEAVWFTQTSSLFTKGALRARNLVWCYDRWLAEDPTTALHGYMDNTIASHYGEVVGWEFGTLITYNEGRGAIFHELELVCLTGRVELGLDPIIWTQYSLDGETWSMIKNIRVGKQGERLKRITWLQQGAMRQWRIQRFRGTSDSKLTVARLEARVEPLAV